MISKYCVNKLIEKGYISSAEKELYEYGFNATIYTIWSTGLLFLVGLLFRQFLDAVIIVFGFYTMQNYGGGYHSDTHSGCFSVMLIGLICGLLSIRFIHTDMLFWILGSISLVTLLIVPLTLHRNKKYLLPKTRILQIKSIAATLIITVIILLLKILLKSSIRPFAAMLTLSALSRIVGAHRNKMS